MAVFYQWIKNIVIFLLLISMIYQLLPDSEYRKYMKVCAGMILMIIVFSPVLKIFGADTRLSYLLGVENLKTQIRAVTYPEALEAADDERIAAVTKNYRIQLEKEAAALFDDGPLYLTDVQVEIEEDGDSEDYGSVKSVSASASASPPADSEDGGIVSVAPVAIGSEADKLQESQTAVPAAYAEQIRQMRKKLADYFMIRTSDVTVMMDGREG